MWKRLLSCIEAIPSIFNHDISWIIKLIGANQMKQTVPELTVIIPVHSRTCFVEDALFSLERQDLNKALFEVLVVTNVEIDLSRNYDLNLKFIKCMDQQLARKLIRGIQSSNAEVIAFLEDDDIFTSDKASKLIALFHWSAPLKPWTKLANKEERKVLKEWNEIEGSPEGEQ